MKRFSLVAISLIVVAAIFALAAQSEYGESAAVPGHPGKCALCLRCLL